MNFYISDTHFGHENVIGFDKRPFTSVEEMEYTMTELWNARVRAEDDVYILGDMVFKRDKSPYELIRRVKRQETPCNRESRCEQYHEEPEDNGTVR